MATKDEIIKAYCEIRETNNTIPDRVLNFMKDAALFVSHVGFGQMVQCKICKKFLSDVIEEQDSNCVYCGHEESQHPVKGLCDEFESPFKKVKENTNVEDDNKIWMSNCKEETMKECNHYKKVGNCNGALGKGHCNLSKEVKNDN